MTKEKNSKSGSKEDQPKFNQEQYDMLMRCSKKKDMTEWNEWRKKNFSENILLEGSDFACFHLNRANFSDYKGIASVGTVFLADASFIHANLEHAQFTGADLRQADFTGAHLTSTNFAGAHLENATLQDIEIGGRYGISGFYYRGACFDEAHLQGADFRRAMVDSSTSFWKCLFDRETDLRDTALVIVQMEQGTKELLAYNGRRMNWQDRYKGHRFLQWPVKLFWSISNYGISTLRIIIWFFGLALLFAGLYYILSVVSPPGVVNSLVEGKEGLVQGWLIPFRSIYFSIVTMTTLGFGDMHANCRSFLGHLLLTIQVILGYVLLGALVTRLAVLFTSDGPAGSFTPMDKETKKLLAKKIRKMRGDIIASSIRP